jgi:hypothetical protein
MRHLRHPATVVSIVALFAALSWGAIAGTLISGSQIKNHSIAAKKLTAGAIQQLRGHRGPAGPTGAQGTAGASGPAGIDSVHTFSQAASYGAFGSGTSVAQATATCPTGSFVVGGSANANTIETPISTFAGTTTYGAVSDNSSSFAGTLTVTAICASGPGLTASAEVAPKGEPGFTATRLRDQLMRRSG